MTCSRSLALAVVILANAVFFAVPVQPAYSHRSGCHRWHSCPSDSGSYVCGDLGYADQCPRARPTVIPKAASTPKGAERAATTSKRKAVAGCHPSYVGACVPVNVEDVDCAGGKGNGPYFVSGPIRVVGVDPYRLDADGDGVACEGR